jgi:hypothetical protein
LLLKNAEAGTDAEKCSNLAADFRGFWPLSPLERSEKPSFAGVSEKGLS